LTGGAKSGSDRAWLAAICALIAVGLCLHARTIGYPFVDWDDTQQVVENPWIRSVSLEHLAAIFSQRVLAAATVLGTAGYMHFALVYLGQNRLEDALRATDRAIETARVEPLFPNDMAKRMAIRGIALERLHRPADAVEAWKAALVIDPDDA
jgi:tetratricopeptide (TPR) repeat protein